MRKLVLFLMGILILSCGEKVVEKPENLIPKEKMADILHDLALMNAAKSAFSKTFDENGIEIMDFIYKKYQIDSVQFVESDLYYASIPLEYQSIYEDVEARIDKRKDLMDKNTKKRNDSIRKAQEKRRDSIRSTKDSLVDP